MFRINFNGQQASRSFGSYAEAKREILSIADYQSRVGQSGHMWIQEYDPELGEWSGAGLSREKRKPHLCADGAR